MTNNLPPGVTQADCDGPPSTKPTLRRRSPEYYNWISNTASHLCDQMTIRMLWRINDFCENQYKLDCLASDVESSLQSAIIDELKDRWL